MVNVEFATTAAMMYLYLADSIGLARPPIGLTIDNPRLVNLLKVTIEIDVDRHDLDILKPKSTVSVAVGRPEVE